MSDWTVPGYEPLELLGVGAAGEVWRARERSSGRLVVLRRISTGDLGALAEVRRRAVTVRALPSQHLVRLRSVLRAGGDDALVFDHADGGSLEALLARRGNMSPGEVVTVLAPLAEALAQAHEHGLRHRRIRASRVLLTSDGRPLLDGLGLDSLYDAADSLDPTGGLGASADVWGLGTLGHLMLGGDEAPEALAGALAAAVDVDSRARPSASQLATALLASCPAEPIRGLPEPIVTPAPPTLAVARVPRRPLLAVAAGVVLLAVVVLGWSWGAHSAPATAEVAPTRAVPTDWLDVLHTLDASRSQAFAQGSPALLLQVYDGKSPLLAQDRRSLTALAARGATVRGLGHEVVSATVAQSTAVQTVLTVTESLSAYALVDRTGRVVERHAAGPEESARIVLVKAAVGWRMQVVQSGT